MTLGACVQTLETTVPFDPNEVAYINQRGSATISGQAFLRQAGGAVVTCAGTEVELIPAGTFATERITQLYGSSAGGRIGSLVGASQENVDPRYFSMVRRATCDAEGDFEFARVANGNYYLLSQVTWTVGNNIFPEGGTIVKRISVQGGANQRVILN